MGEVVDLNTSRVKRDGTEVVSVSMWTCKCGCSQFYLIEGGAVVCTGCQAQQSNISHVCPPPKGA